MHGHGSLNVSRAELMMMQIACEIAGYKYYDYARAFKSSNHKADSAKMCDLAQKFILLSKKKFSRDYKASCARLSKQRLVRMTVLARRLIHADDVMAKSDGAMLYKARDMFDRAREELRDYINIHPVGGKLEK